MREIVVGDVHGCLEELDELLRIVEYTPQRDRLHFVGDLVDRGPDSIGVVRRVRELGAVCVLGNHDEWYVRCARHAETERRTGKANPLRKNATKFALYEQMFVDDITWLSELPLYHRLDSRTIIVHAGLRPNVAIEDQAPRDLLRMRYLRRATGEMWDMSSDELLTPAVAAYWTEVWRGPDDVIYGHHPSKTDTVFTSNPTLGPYDPEIDLHVRGYARCWGIDTGCCFGNKLTALMRGTGCGGQTELVSVPAKAQYVDWHKSMRDE